MLFQMDMTQSSYFLKLVLISSSSSVRLIWLSSSAAFMFTEGTDAPWLFSDSGPAAATLFPGCGSGCVVLTIVTLVFTNALHSRCLFSCLLLRDCDSPGVILALLFQTDTHVHGSIQINQHAREYGDLKAMGDV